MSAQPATEPSDTTTPALGHKPMHEPFECDCGGEFVMHDGDKLCADCGLVSGSESVDVEVEGPWGNWWEERRSSDYSGWTGKDRIKFVGGFVSAYVAEEGGLSV